MAATQHHRDLTTFLARQGSEAIRRHGVPGGVARAACSITARKFATGYGWDGETERRAQAYFWGVVRRRALGAGSDVAVLRERYVAATVAADMLEGGHAAERVREEMISRFGVGAHTARTAACYL